MAPSERNPLLLSSSPAELNKVSTAKLGWILCAVWTAIFLVALDGTIVATVQQPIGTYFKESHKASYVGTSYLLSACCFTPLYGRLSDILGRKGAMLLGLSLLTIGMALSAIAPSMKALIIARAIAGMGGGGIVTVASIVVSDLVSMRNRGLMQGAATLIWGIGAAIGGPLGGYISDHFGWRIAFLVQIPLLISSISFVAIHVDTTGPCVPFTMKQKLKRIDWLGCLTLACFVGALLSGLSFKATEELRWSDIRVYGSLIASALALVAFIYMEARISPEPVMPFRLLLRRTPLSVCLTTLLSSAVSYGVVFNVPLYIMAVRLQTASQAGMYLVPYSVALPIGGLVAGWVIRRRGKYGGLIIAGTSLSLFSTGLMVLWKRNDTSNFQICFAIVLDALGVASTLTCNTIAMIACVSRDDMAVSTGMMYLFRTTGRVIGVSLSGTIFQGVLVDSLRKRMPDSDSAKIIDRIRHNTALVMTLEGTQREAVISSFAQALKVVMICQVALALMAVACTVPMQDKPLQECNEAQVKPYRQHQGAIKATGDA